MISDAGYQGEITSISTASQQIEVYSRILKNFITESIKTTSENRQNTIQECAVGFFLTFKFKLLKIYILLIHLLNKNKGLIKVIYFNIYIRYF